MRRGTKPAAVIGSGPNGLAAAITLARAGVDVTVFEVADTIGGGTRTQSTTLPNVVHDICSAIHPMAFASPFFQQFELEKRVEFHVPDVSYAHPLDGRRAVLAHRDINAMVSELGQDGPAYRRLLQPLLTHLDGATNFALGGSMLRFPTPAGVLVGLRVAELGILAGRIRFREDAAPALLAGVAAHSIGHSPSLSAAAIGVMLSLYGHAQGWPVPLGGSQAITAAMAADLKAHGGTIETGREITSMSELAGFGSTIFATSPRALARIAGSALPDSYRRKLNAFRYGAAAAKVDFVLDGPIPWRDARVAQTPTVHVAGSRADIADAENAVQRGRHAARPYVLLAQPTVFDPARNPAGTNAVWTYAHVPHGSTRDVTNDITQQIERFAPGFRDRVIASHVTTAQEMGQYNANYIGGDINAGAVDLRQLIARPVLSPKPWQTPTPGIYLASSATPPGPGVHGLPGWYAAQHALRNEYGLPAPNLSVSGS